MLLPLEPEVVIVHPLQVQILEKYEVYPTIATVNGPLTAPPIDQETAIDPLGYKEDGETVEISRNGERRVTEYPTLVTPL